VTMETVYMTIPQLIPSVQAEVFDRIQIEKTTWTENGKSVFPRLLLLVAFFHCPLKYHIRRYRYLTHTFNFSFLSFLLYS
jgi:hypothetical protein